MKVNWSIKQSSIRREAKNMTDWDSLNNEKQSLIKQYILQLVTKASTEQIDKRILKNIFKENRRSQTMHNSVISSLFQSATPPDLIREGSST